MSAKSSFSGRVLKPVGGEFRPASGGAPAVPARFSVQGGGHLGVVSVVEEWRDYADCHHGGTERYLRRHWYKVVSEDQRVARIYFDRQPRRGRPATERWCLYAWESSSAADAAARDDDGKR